MIDVLDLIGRVYEYFIKKLKKEVHDLSEVEYELWKELQYKNDLAYEVYLEQKIITEECNSNIPIYESKLWKE